MIVEKEGQKMYLLIIAFIGYLFGCINGSQIIGKYKHIDIKNHGSKNAGASNVTLQLGWKSGLFVVMVDVFKAIISLYIVTSLLIHADFLFEYQVLLLYINALFVIVGHNFPLTMHFNGGKGTASFLGILLFIDWKIAIMAFVMFLLVAFATNYFVIGTFFAYVFFIAYTSFTYGGRPVYIAFLLTVLFLFKHVDNVKRIINKEETKLSSLLRRHAS
jgi:glycerol-3-phosphate acyltransferase PlsY